MRHIWILSPALMSLLLGACESSVDSDITRQVDAKTTTEAAASVDVSITPQVDAEPATDVDVSTEPESEESDSVFTHKLLKKTGENPFASLAYECPQCTFEQWESIDPPEGWSKGPAQVSVFSEAHSIMRSFPVVEGHPDSEDFLEDVPGNEYRVIAITRSGRIVQLGGGGTVAEVQVERDTLLVFKVGMRVHELTDPEGHVFVLFAHHVDAEEWKNTDFQSEDALSYFAAPEGWSYSTRVLDEDLALDSDNHDGVVTVLAIRGAVNSSWEKR